MVQWTKTCRQIFNIDYQYMLCYWQNILLYCCKTQQEGSYQNNVQHFITRIYFQIKKLLSHIINTNLSKIFNEYVRNFR